MLWGKKKLLFWGRAVISVCCCEAKLLSRRESAVREAGQCSSFQTRSRSLVTALSPATFGPSPFPTEAKNISFEPRFLIILLPSQKGEITRLYDCCCQLQSPKFWCGETVSPFGSSRVPPSRMRTEPVPAFDAERLDRSYRCHAWCLKFPKRLADSCDRIFFF